MGSFPSPSLSLSPSSSPDNSLSGKIRVYLAFRFREAKPNVNVSDIMIYCYDISDNSWSFVTLVPCIIENQGVKDFAMVSLGDSIYIIGGKLFHQKQDHTSEEDDSVSSSVLRYNVCTNQWSNCASMALPRYDFAYTVCENKIYVAGGKSTLNSVVGVSSAEVYDPNLDKWIHLPDMSTLRYKCVAVTWMGKIHVVGGFALKTNSDVTPHNFMAERCSVEVYDTKTRQWGLMRGMWQLDVPPNQIVVVNGKLLSSGDCLKVWKGHIEAYDLEQNIWNELEGSRLNCEHGITNNSTTIQQLYLTIAPIGNSLYFLAGYRMDGDDLPRMKSTVFKFDTSASNDGWMRFETIEEEGEKVLCSHCCVVQLS
ncbi:hypothetical protein CsatB_000059 [Cannabis sativa]|uniref:Uncharacterized protein n=1 Tax=Cannabis sativa TaxID=3483 RepID=A0A7J6F2C1_CANSA|nr:hypothetical protein G4B88_002837 [Cannabis sativa]KAF4363840.1 hypothetical protein F8388_000505 [Cannabis sativa]